MWLINESSQKATKMNFNEVHRECRVGGRADEHISYLFVSLQTRSFREAFYGDCFVFMKSVLLCDGLTMKLG